MAISDSPLLRPVRRSGMRVVVYVGTFDPMHMGHLDAAAKCLAAGVDEVLFVPNPTIKRKSAATSREHRLAITCAAVQNDDRLNVFCADPTPYMPRDGDWTLRSLLTYVKKLYSASEVGELCGSDAFASYPPEKNPQYFFGQAIFLASRPPYPAVDAASVPNCVPIGGTIGHSSSAIRQAIKENASQEELLALGLPAGSYPYIHEHGLYGRQ
eukprot:TRINITY_DN2348_c1_g2_i1.p2 TRINITY_DN2348_c1_g2~~TRINITY_DN2348_c1_g2_i1.p2  ORF type:complete len:212 (+),score=61.56 TRINITY_DN2348_c1_g2_i1:283-918(+)